MVALEILTLHRTVVLLQITVSPTYTGFMQEVKSSRNL